jgi:hypothetical protein
MSSVLFTAVLLVAACPDCATDRCNCSESGSQLAAVTVYTPRTYYPAARVVYPSPCYDCYSHNHRRLDCYPGFRELHYRRPYNYRLLIDYPWHADLHPPMHVGPPPCLPYGDGDAPPELMESVPGEPAAFRPAAYEAVAPTVAPAPRLDLYDRLAPIRGTRVQVSD